ncbi:MAG: ATP-dependent carboxylate-amine ligase, partial [Bacteroidota bacterium]
MKYNIGITGTGSLVGQAIIKSIIRSEYKDDYNLTGFDY